MTTHAFRGLALYDLDGTLVDSGADLTTAVNQVRAAHRLPPVGVPRVVANIGDGPRPLMARVVPEAPVPLDELEAALRRAYAGCVLDATRLYPGVREALETLHRAGWCQAVVSNKAAAHVREIVRGLGLEPLLQAAVGCDEGVPPKPDPAPLRLAMARAGWREGQGPAWMVGDHCTDLESGRRAGLQRCFCRYGFGEPRGETWELAVDDLRAFAAAVTPA